MADPRMALVTRWVDGGQPWVKSSDRSCPSGLSLPTTLSPNDLHLPAPRPEVSKVNEKFHPQQPCAWICFPHPCVMRPSAQPGRDRDYFFSLGIFNPSQPSRGLLFQILRKE